MKFNRKILLVSLVMVSFFSYAQKVKTRKVTIEGNLSFQNYEHFKRLVLNSPDSEIEFLEGFDFEWGYTYLLKVKETKLKSEYSDGTRYEYEFVSVLEKTPVGDTLYRLTIDPSRYYYDVPEDEKEANKTLKPINDSTYLYFDEVELVIPSALQAPFLKLIESNQSKRGYFRVVNGQLVLERF